MPHKPFKKKILIGAIACGLLAAIAVGIWRLNAGPSGIREAAKQPSAQDQDRRRDSKKADVPDDQMGELKKAEDPTDTAAPVEQAPELENPTISKPLGSIMVDAPRDKEVIIASRFMLAGKADVPDDIVFYEVEDDQGRQWIAGATHADGKWGDYSIEINLINSKYLSASSGGPHYLTIKVHGGQSHQNELATVSATIVPR